MAVYANIGFNLLRPEHTLARSEVLKADKNRSNDA
jgi:hypothetical protein